MSEMGNILEASQNQYGPHVQVTPQNEVIFKIQEGPIREVGENGCQIDTMVRVARDVIAFFNKRFPCRENSCAITKLDEALHWLKARTDRRTAEGIEGTSVEAPQ